MLNFFLRMITKDVSKFSFLINFIHFLKCCINNYILMRKLSIYLFFIFSTICINAQTYDGYTLYSPQNGSQAFLLDMSGNIFHTWSFSASQKTGYAIYLLPGGTLLRTVSKTGNSFTGGPICGEVQEMDWNGNITWDFVYSTTQYCTHHDICGMPNGNVLLIAYERKTAAELTQAGCSQSIEMWPDKIVEIQPSGLNGGNIVWEWHAWDHLCQNYNSAKDNYVTSIVDHPELMNINYLTCKDWMHMNGIDYNAVLDQITFSSHNLSEIYVIDHSTTTAQAAVHIGGNSGMGGDIIYRWGNPAAYNAPGTADFNVVHDAHWVPDNCPKYANYLAGFNNKGGTGGKTCVDVFSPPYNGYNYALTLGSAYLPATYSFRSTYIGTTNQDNGNSQQLPNGNMLLCMGMSGYIYEIDSSQNVVWSKNVGSVIAQAFRYSYDYVTGFQEIKDAPLKINIYPNPTSGLIHVEKSIPADEANDIFVYNSFGKLILHVENSKTVDLSSYDSGIYFLQVKSDKGVAAKKVNLIK